MTDGNSEEAAHGGSEDEAAWLDLIDRYDAPAHPDHAAVPWPDSENLPAAPAGGAAAIPDAGSAPAGECGVLPAGSGFTPTSAGNGGITPAPAPDGWIIPVPQPGNGSFPAPGRGPDADPLEEEHFVPPPPPPLPRLAPTQKGAWVGLFGGPGYLLVATVAGWSVPGWLAICAIAAFVGGFVTLVLHLGDDPGRDSDPDDGAVV